MKKAPTRKVVYNDAEENEMLRRALKKKNVELMEMKEQLDQMTERYVRAKSDRDHYRAKIHSAKSDIRNFDQVVRAKVEKKVYAKNQEIRKLKQLARMQAEELEE